ncbi:STAS domain-containing protein [Streptodolium elevatio]|uniref:Anti-sigma factor antagonist n=1 Tax=Streptodolium elevatio TaxID=3157996 RepID=A0ABV3DMR4_9ACTN
MPNSQPVPAPLTVHRCDTTTGALLTVRGEIDLDTEPHLRGSMTRCLLDGCSAIDVDLSDVTFCDSSGLHAFLDISRDAAKAGGYLRLHSPSPIVVRLLTLTGTGTLVLGLPTCPSPPEPTVIAAEPPVGSGTTGQLILFTDAARAADTADDPQIAHRTRTDRTRTDRVRVALSDDSRTSLGAAPGSQVQRATHEDARSWQG